MLTAVWTVLGILKIAGLILLGVSGFLLVVILLILLVPIRYQVRGSFYGKPKGQAGASWLCHILSIKAVYEEKLELAVRVFGIRIFHLEKSFGRGEKEESAEKQKTGKEEESSKGPEQTLKEAKESSEGREQTLKEARESPEGPEQAPKEAKELPGEPEQTSEEYRANSETDLPEIRRTEEESHEGWRENRKPEGENLRTESEEEKPGLSQNEKRQRRRQKEEKGRFSFHKIYDKLKELLRRLKNRLLTLREKLAGLKEKKERLEAFLHDEANCRTLRLLKKQLWVLCRHIFPQKASGKVRFGFEDPYTTGQVLTYISPFYGLYARTVQVIPVFGESVLEGEGKLRGRIRIGTVIAIVVRVLLDRNFRRLLRELRK